MRYKRLTLVLSLIIISFIYIFHPYIEERQKKDLEESIIRFHIRANSNKEEDQELKLKIRDKILEAMNPKFDSVISLEDSRNLIIENMEEMKSITEEVIHEEGKEYEVGIKLGQDSFPTRKYGNLVLPSGDYETLLITLGEGKGQNWWCVMFPPLCFVDITHSVAYNTEKDLNLKSEEKPKLKLKWKTAEVIEGIKKKDKAKKKDKKEISKYFRSIYNPLKNLQ